MVRAKIFMGRRLKNGLLVAGMTLGVIGLGGCSFKQVKEDISNKYQEYIEDGMLSSAGIYEDSDYLSAADLADKKMIDTEGYYVGEVNIPEMDEYDALMKQIRASICRNNKITYQCSLDEENINVIAEDYFYINPGESIFISNIACTNDYAGCYSLDCIRIVEYDESGERGDVIAQFSAKDIDSNGTIKYTIEDSYTGADIAIEALGIFSDRQLYLSSYWKKNQVKYDVECEWFIDDKKVDEFLVKPYAEYTVKMIYDADKFYYVGANQDIYNVNDNDGSVEFYMQTKALGFETVFDVELYPYTNIAISDSKKVITKMEKNGVEFTRDLELNNLKKGDRLTFVISDGYKIESDWGDATYEYNTTGGKKFSYVVGDYAYDEINLSTVILSEKEIQIDIDKNNKFESFFGNLWNGITGFFGAGNIDDELFVIEIVGGDKYTYSDLKNNKKVMLKEYEQLVIDVNKEQLNGNTLVITINGTDSFEVSESSEEFRFAGYNYNNLSSIEIEAKE